MRVVPAVVRAAALLVGMAPAMTAHAQSIAQSASAQPAQPGAPTLRLTVDEAVRMALEQNLNLRVERLNPELEDQNVLQARTAWIPSLTGSFGYNNADSPPDSFLSGSTQTLKSDALSGNVGVQQLLPWGATYDAGWDVRRSTTNSIFTNFDPTLRSNLNLGFTQPLFRNRVVDSARTQLVVSRRNRDISDVQLRGSVVTTVRNVKAAYWNLKAAIANLEVQRQSLDLARQTLRDNRTRVEVGTMAPIDIVEAEAEVARNEENVIVAEATILRAEDVLRVLIYDRATAELWNTRLDPVDPPQVEQKPIDIEAAVRNALDKRTDLQSTKRSLENVETNATLYKNQTLPQVNFEVTYGATGLGGTEFERTPGFPPGEIISEQTRGFWTVQQDVFSNAYPTWQLGVSVSYPLGKSAAHTSYARSQIQLNQGKLQVQNLELQIATQVRDLGRQVNTNAQRVQATRASRILAERRLEAEQKKFGVGTSTSFLVFQAQRDLATARVNELSALLDYNKSLVDFEAIQEAAISGGGNISLSGSTTTSTGSAVQPAAASAAGGAQQR